MKKTKPPKGSKGTENSEHDNLVKAIKQANGNVITPGEIPPGMEALQQEREPKKTKKPKKSSGDSKVAIGVCKCCGAVFKCICEIGACLK